MGLTGYHKTLKWNYYFMLRRWCIPKVMRTIFFLCSTDGPGKESVVRGRWRVNPGIQFDIPQLSLCLSTSRFVTKVGSSFCVLLWAKMYRSLEQCYTIKFCGKLGKSGSETLQLLRTAYGDAVLSSGDRRCSEWKGEHGG
jgi:hypothetical protein